MAEKRKTPNPVDAEVGARVRGRRKALGMSQERLGERLGITFQQVQKYEKGTNRIGASRLQQISEALDMPVGDFFAGALNAEPAPASGSAFAEPERPGYKAPSNAISQGEQLKRAFGRISDPNVRMRILELVDALVESDRKR